jgi:hypothetical protein
LLSRGHTMYAAAETAASRITVTTMTVVLRPERLLATTLPRGAPGACRD